MLIRLSFLDMGLKNGKPERWSQCAWVKSMWISRVPFRASLLPRHLMPVPASITMRSPESLTTSMHVVSPPYFRKSSPETEMDPREPQQRISMAVLFEDHSGLGGFS